MAYPRLGQQPVRFCLWGPVRAVGSAGPLDLGPARQRCVLAALLVSPRQVVPRDALVDRVWGTATPRRVDNVLASYVSRLRHLLGRGMAAAPPLRHQAGGYLIDCDPVEVDAHRVNLLLARAREEAAAGRLDAAADALGQACNLCLGIPLAGLAGEWVERVRDQLQRDRLAALGEHIDVQLRLGNHAGVVDEATELAQQHPLHERLAAQAMVALYRCGRPAEALQHYADLRRRLRDDLGTEPDASTRQLHQRILCGDPTPDLAATEAARRRGSSTLWQAPPVPSPFVGRARQMTAAATALTGRAEAGRSPVVLLHGMAGVGKSALAAAVAHEQRPRYPDGCLYVNLNGYDPRLPPADPLDVLARLLRTLGVTGPVPAEVDEATAVLRATLTDRAMLIILDNAASPDQLRPLLPASPSCAVLATSRRAISTLDAAAIRVDKLDEAAALALLRGIAGPARILADPDAARDTTRMCGHLPLALRIVAGRLASHPHWSLRRLATRLAAQQRLLDELRADDLDVRSSFQVSYQALRRETTPTARTAATALCLLGRHDPTDIAIPATAALLNTDTTTAEQALDRLAADHLLDTTTGGRYRFHDLLRIFARELATAHLTTADWDPALRRLLQHYLDRVIEANHVLRLRPAPQAQATHFTSYRQAQHWMDSERTNVHAAIHAGTTGTDTAQRLALRLALELTPFLGTWGHWNAVRTTAATAINLAHQLHDRQAIAQAHGDLGSAKLHTNDHTGALTEVRKQLALYQQMNDPRGICRALNNIAVCARHTGDYPTARTHLEHALAIRRSLHEHQGEAMALDNLALVHQSMTNYTEAITLHRKALHIARTLPDPLLEALILINLAQTHQKAGHPRKALAYLDQAAEPARQCNNTTAQATALDIRSQALTDLGNHQAAHTCQQRATQLRNQLESQ